MKREFLKSLNLENEVIDKIMSCHGEDIEKFKTQADELEKLKTDLKNRDEQLEKLKTSTANMDDLKAQIETLQNENKTNNEKYQNELKQIKINNAVEKALINANARNTKVIMPLLSEFLSTAEIDDKGNVKDLEKQIKSLVESNETSFLFEAKTESPTILKGVTPSENANAQPSTAADFSKMSYEQICEYMQANPDTKI